VRITHLWRYPVKSLGGEALEAAQVEHTGIRYDRSFRLIDQHPHRQGKPLTGRELPGMLGYRASASNGGVAVRTPDGATIAAGERLAAAMHAALGRPMSIEPLVTEAYPFFDDCDLLICNAASVRALEREMGIAVNPLRFRPSILLDGADATPFVEDTWVGARVEVGAVALEIVQRNVRCAMTNIDPDTCVVDPAYLKHLVQRHEQCFGVYARVRVPGRIALGDEWRVVPSGSQQS
jgi:uncharacterized protein YcbX